MKELASPLEPELVRIAAFSDGLQGGNPAGVWIGASLPGAHEMQHIAAEVGFSETAFAAPMSTPLPQGAQAVEPTAELREWRVRYFSPEAEVPFCGHATIALGVALARRFGEGEYGLHLNQAVIKVSGWLGRGTGRPPCNRRRLTANRPPPNWWPPHWISSVTHPRIWIPVFPPRSFMAAPIIWCWP